MERQATLEIIKDIQGNIQIPPNAQTPRKRKVTWQLLMGKNLHFRQ